MFVRSFFVLFYLLLLISVLTLDYYWIDRSPWLNWESSTKQRIGGIPFCEHDRSTNLLRERSNALSDFSFLAVGFYMLVQSIENPTHMTAKHAILSVVNGLANCAHAIGSWLNHACRCQFGHRLDLTGMWLIVSFIALYSLTRRACVRTSVFSFIFLVIGYLLWLLSDVYYPESYENREKILIIALIIIFLVSESWQINFQTVTIEQIRYLSFGLITLAVGVLCGHLDATRRICWPESWFQLHALWHICAACSVWTTYEYFRCETILDSNNNKRHLL